MKDKLKKIMIVDDNVTNLTAAKNLLKPYYDVYPALSAADFFEIIKSIVPDLILLDVEMPDMDGYETLKKLKADSRFNHIPVIFLTVKDDMGSEFKGLDLGAADYVSKPFSAPILLKRIENHLKLAEQKTELILQKAELKNLNDNLLELVREKTIEVVDLQTLLISSMAGIIEFRDAFTGEHIANTKKYVELLGNYLLENNIYSEEISKWHDIDNMFLSTQLHDIGKIFISDMILNKPGKLTPEEYEQMKEHVPKGVEAIKIMKEKGVSKDFLDSAEIVAATHHERWDGKGYPAALKEKETPLIGRLMAVADVYDALTSARPYKQPFSAEYSARIIIDGAGTHFDPVLVDVFKMLRKDFAAIHEIV